MTGMTLDWSAQDKAFCEEVRAFLDENLTPEIRACGSLMTSVYADHDVSMKWQQILHKKGWAAPAWPVEYGGAGWGVTQRYIFTRERIRAGAPPTSPMGIDMVAHAIIKFGTPKQKSFFLPRMLTGEHFWCQGYSEPGSGSDLASLQMSAMEDGDDLVCNGAKIWQTHAGEANWIFCLVRTSKTEKKQQGITFLLIDMDTPGVDVRPIVMTSGEQIQNQVFFDNVRVPKANILGEIDDGWTVAKYLLEFERGGAAYAPGLKVRLENLARQVAGRPSGGSGVFGDDPLFTARLARLRMRVDALEVLEFRILSALSSGQGVGLAASMMKILGTELSQEVSTLAMEAAGIQSRPYQPHAAFPAGPVANFTPPEEGYVSGESWQAIAPLMYLNDRAGSIYAGSNEIQRNILAKGQLGL